MTTNPPDACRKLAEQIWDAITVWADEEQFKDETVDLIFQAIRDHTAYPDVLRMLEVVERESLPILKVQVRRCLAKAKGIEP